jgi:hypothetical protein
MLIYGQQQRILLKRYIPDTCPHCRQNNTLELSVRRRYFHLFWIPVFPTKKTISTFCGHCKQVLEKKEMPSGLLQSCEVYLPEAKTPKWMYSGLVVLAALITWVSIAIADEKRNTGKYRAQPQVGDVYTIDLAEGGYTLYRIARLSGDSVYFEMNDYEAPYESKLERIKVKENGGFNGVIIGHSKSDVEAMWSSGEIEKIKR